MRLNAYDAARLVFTGLSLSKAQAAVIGRRAPSSAADVLFTLRQGANCVALDLNFDSNVSVCALPCRNAQSDQHWRHVGQKLHHVGQGCLGAQANVAGASIDLVACNTDLALNFTRTAAGGFSTNNGALCLHSTVAGLDLQPCADTSALVSASIVYAPSTTFATTLETTTTLGQGYTSNPAPETSIVAQTIVETITIGTSPQDTTVAQTTTVPHTLAPSPQTMTMTATATATTFTTPTVATTTAAPTPVASSSVSSSLYNPVCTGLADWPEASAAFEAEVLRLVNEQRSQQTTCGTTVMPAQDPLTVDDAITCVSRAFAQDMSQYDYFSHTDRAGNSPFQRLSNAGVSWSAAAENIAYGQSTPSQVVSAWVQSPGHCTDLMSDYTKTGVGFSNNYWVQDFTRP